MNNTKEVFDTWNDLKWNIHNDNVKEFFVKPKQVWYIHAGVNVGYETNGKGIDFKRVVLVLKKIGNMFLVVNMTTKGKDDNVFYYRLDDSYFRIKSYVMLSQIKVIDKKRFIEELGELSGKDFIKIKKEIQNLFF